MINQKIIKMRHFFKGFTLMALSLAAAPHLWGAATEPVRQPNVEVELLTDANTIGAGESFWIGIRYEMEPGWHIYWKNYGDTGIPTEIEWILPEGFEAGELHWPTPGTYLMSGLMNYVYEDEVILMAEVQAPTTLKPGDEVAVGARTHWLVCEDICIPGEAELTLNLPVGEKSVRDNRVVEQFETQRKGWPRKSDLWTVRGEVVEDRVTLLIEANGEGLPPLENLYFFSESTAIDPSANQEVDTLEDGTYRMVLKLSSYHTEPVESLPGILKSSSGWEPNGFYEGLRVNPLKMAEAKALAGGEKSDPGVAANGQASIGLLQAAFFALIGGILLNLMPCVFPVLGLKVMGFVKQAGEDPKKIRRHGLLFFLGVLVSLWVLVGAIFMLRAAGDFLGWGFQLQEPRFVAFVIFLFFAFGLNLAGVFEIGNSLVGTGSELTRKEGMSGSFFSGVLAVIVATPCTAPFMGVAIGFALGAPYWMTLLIFTMLGVGLALPYLTLSFFPGMVRVLPSPGPWMESFKQFMAFPLFAAALYFLWVFGMQTGLDSTIHLLFGLLLMGMGLWIYGRWAAPHRKVGIRTAATAMGLLLVLGGFFYGIRGQGIPYSPVDEDRIAGLEGKEKKDSLVEHGVTWEIWSEDKVSRLREQGKTVYVDFTAAWCLTCQANKRAVFSSEKVRERFNRNDDLVLMKADWTNRDPDIARALESFGRSGVPLNVIYPPSGSPVVLPAVLTPGIVMDALDEVLSKSVETA